MAGWDKTPECPKTKANSFHTNCQLTPKPTISRAVWISPLPTTASDLPTQTRDLFYIKWKHYGDIQDDHTSQAALNADHHIH